MIRWWRKTFGDGAWVAALGLGLLVFGLIDAIFSLSTSYWIAFAVDLLLCTIGIGIMSYVFILARKEDEKTGSGSP